MPCHIAFFIDLNGLWTGGFSYYENLLRAVRTVASPSEFKLIGLFPQHDPLNAPLYNFLDEVHFLPAPSIFNRRIEKINFLLPNRYRPFFPLEPDISKEARLAKADVLFLSWNPSPHYRIPTLRWFPDFQYLHYPEMFSSAEVSILGNEIKNMAKYSDRVILSSESVKQDFARVAPEFINKARVLSFTSFVDKSAYASNPRQICEKYHLPEKFFHLPNQFWKHKNHSLVLEALTLARRQNPDITIVSTGMLSDYRNPLFPSEFITNISRSGNRDNFILLGSIPRDHLYSIMRQSLAVIQPSKSDG